MFCQTGLFDELNHIKESNLNFTTVKIPYYLETLYQRIHQILNNQQNYKFIIGKNGGCAGIFFLLRNYLDGRLIK
jgi:hypothetical protein